MPLEISPAEFDRLVEQALDSLPDEIAARVHNVVVLVEPTAPAGHDWEPPRAVR